MEAGDVHSARLYFRYIVDMQSLCFGDPYHKVQFQVAMRACSCGRCCR